MTTVVCGKRELYKLLEIGGQLNTVKRVICMDDEIPSHASSIQSYWTVTSFTNVERLGRDKPVDADLPVSTDIAVIMYTSGSTALPKVSRCVSYFKYSSSHWIVHFSYCTRQGLICKLLVHVNFSKFLFE